MSKKEKREVDKDMEKHILEQANLPSLDDLIKLLEAKFEKPNPIFIEKLKDLFTEKSMESDYAYHYLNAHASEFREELLLIYEPMSRELAERAYRNDDSGNWYHSIILELITYSNSPKTMYLLERELQHPHSLVRQAAIAGLASLSRHNVEARKLLANAWKIELRTEQETQAFHEEVQRAMNIIKSDDEARQKRNKKK